MSSRNVYKLFVGNMSWTSGSKEIRMYFSKFGNVKNAYAVFDKNTGLHKGYGFVTFTSKEDYDNVLKTQHKFEGSLLSLQPSHDD